ncbi:Peroxisomal fatty acid beta-oxidation multifunctional protein AIM1 [Sesamum angolense]|uniref:Peroxisomal fatty acid beta-oxidation multifunctional protein AIM1 n=1 Tax=Sesamum angolense TaxID=2727404 RepID=A0AAE1WE52_9LAMI|nr:Peroxisomal fatty acid beta-oxidation multifunctional protein AIM1 [Sesamum angolense]
MKQASVTMEVGSDGVAVITFSNPPVNALALTVFDGFKEKFSEAMRRDDVKAIVVTGNGGRFSGGFDINVFEMVHKTGDISILPDASVDIFTNMIEDGKKPTVAAIEGLALGGGLELALVCHARIAAPRTQLGLPELTLGVLPGSGGTQRLPRLIGLPKALEIMLLSKPITSEEGKKLGLIDAVVPSDELLKVSRQWALDIAGRRKPWLRSLHRTDKLGSLPEVHDIINTARQQAKQTAKNMPQHQACLDVIEEGIIHGGYHGLLKESKVFKELVSTDTSKGLVHAFFAQRATTKVANVSDIGLKPRSIKKVAVIGGGLMGSGIATALILSDIYVILKEINSEYLLKGIKAIEDFAEFSDVDMVIEAVIENISLKQQIFADIEKACPPHSYERFHFDASFFPAHVMPLLEIIRTEKTSPQVILDLMTVGKTIKKVPVVVGNCTGIDQLICNFGLPLGPFQLQDLAGYGVAVATTKEFSMSFPERTFESPLVKLLIKNGRNGKSNGKGYYIYEKGSKPKPDPSVLPVVEESRRLTNIMPGGKPISVTDEEIVDMVLFPVVNEACRVLDDGVVVRASDLDIASVLGMSFPSYRKTSIEKFVCCGSGGIIFWADTIGANRVYRSLQKWSEVYGNFFRPSRFLEERATRGIPLSAPASTSSGARPRL